MVIAPVVLINSTLGIDTKFVPAIVKDVSVVGSAIRDEVVIVGIAPSPVSTVIAPPKLTEEPLIVLRYDDWLELYRKMRKK